MNKTLCGFFVATSLTVFAQTSPTAGPSKLNQNQGAAAAAGQPGQSQASPPQTQITGVNRASSLIGMPVKDQAGKMLGKVQDVVFDLEKGQIGYVVLALSAKGQNPRLVPVPTSAIKPVENQHALALNMSEAILAAASSITNDQWPAVDTFAVGAPATTQKGTGQSSSPADPGTALPRQ